MSCLCIVASSKHLSSCLPTRICSWGKNQEK